MPQIALTDEEWGDLGKIADRYLSATGWVETRYAPTPATLSPAGGVLLATLRRRRKLAVAILKAQD